MGEPALQLPEEDQPDIKPRLQALEGGGESTPKKSDHLKAVAGNKESIAAAENGEGEASENAYGSSALDDINDTLGRGFHNDGKKSLLSRGFNSKSKLKKRLAIAGAVGAGGVVSSVLVFFAMLPLKVESIITNLENRTGAASSQALEKESTNLFKNYLNTYVIRNLGRPGCKTTADANCVSVVAGDGPIAKLYQAWRQDKLTQKLATKYNLSFAKSGTTYYINTNGKRFDFSNKQELADTLSDKGTNIGERHEIEAILRQRLKEGTLLDRVYYRFRLAPFVNRKFGTRHCINACKVLNKFTDKLAVKKQAAKAYTTERVIAPLSKSYAFILQCALVGPGECNVTNLRPAESGDTSRHTDGDEGIRTRLRASAAGFGDKELSQLVDEANKYEKDGLGKYLVKEVTRSLVDLAGKDGAKAGATAAKAVDPLTWALIAEQLSSGARSVGPMLKYLGYTANAAAAAQIFTEWQSVSSEMKSGQIDAAQLGSFSNALSTSLDTSDLDSMDSAQQALKGSDITPSDATQTPLYQATMGTGKSSGTQTASLLGGTAYAASTDNAGYRCDDKQPVSSGVICDEEFFPGSTSMTKFIEKMSSAYNTYLNVIPGLNGVLKVLHAGNAAINWVTEGALKLLSPLKLACKLPLSPCSQVQNIAESAANAAMDATMKIFFHSPFAHLSGGRLWDMLFGGASVVYNASAQENLGAAHVDDATAAKIQTAYLEEQQAVFDQRPLFARMFSTDTPYSLVSRVAVSMPSSFTTMGTSVVATMQQNPLGAFGHIFSSVFASRSASAATSADLVNPFGVPQAAYTDAQIPKNPEQFWKNNCVNGPEGKWTESNPVGKQLDISEWLNVPTNVTQDKETGQAIFLKPNRCLLILASVQSAGGLADPTLLPEDTQTSDGSNGGSIGSYRVATLNLVDAPAHNADSHRIGNCPASSSVSECAAIRMQRAAQVIKGSITGGAIDIIGTQETSAMQFRQLKGYLGSNYGVYPAAPTGGGGGGSADQHPIWWNNTKFTFIEGGVVAGTWYHGQKGETPWVHLRSSAGGDLYVYNVHAPFGGYGGGDYHQERATTARNMLADIKSRVPTGTPVYTTGDYNSTFSPRTDPSHMDSPDRQLLPYCILTKDNTLANAYDVYKKKTGACPSTGIKGVKKNDDHVFLRPGENVANWQSLWSGTLVEHISDHPIVIASIQGSDSSATTSAPTTGQGFVGNDGFGGGWCTDYVKYILGRHSSKYRGGSMGDGKDFARNLGRLGYTVNHTPAIHAVVSFPGPPYGFVGTRYAGHVAIVGKINADGSIVVEESNFTNPMRYGTHTVKASEAKTLTYAHTEVGWH